MREKDDDNSDLLRKLDGAKGSTEALVPGNVAKKESEDEPTGKSDLDIISLDGFDQHIDLQDYWMVAGGGGSAGASTGGGSSSGGGSGGGASGGTGGK